MTKTRLFSSAAIFAALFFLLAMPSAARCDPQTDPGCRLSPLESRQVNPAASTADGQSTDLSTSGAPAAAAAAVQMPLVSADSISGVGAREASTEHRAPSSQQQALSSALGASAPVGSAPSFETLHLRMRYQSPTDVGGKVIAAVG